MSVGIIFDSIEWSNNHLSDIIRNAGIETELINLNAEPVSFDRIGRHAVLINRLFPSAFFRGHQQAYALARNVLHVAEDMGIEMINPYSAFTYDWSKMCTGMALEKHGLPSPQLLAYFSHADQLNEPHLVYPSVMKPDCGGRSRHTYILNNEGDLEQAIQEIPPIPFLIQPYIHPTKEFTTRIEIVGDKVISVMKRYVGDNAISSYHAGSVFQDYPECPAKVIASAVKALRVLHIDMGSLDIIETDQDKFFIIDVNATSNFSEDNVAMFGYDPIRPMAEYIISRYKTLSNVES
jgi:glutathione synthase/RimK-type ligase-like ATP-grasp enzyme